MLKKDELQLWEGGRIARLDGDPPSLLKVSNVPRPTSY